MIPLPEGRKQESRAFLNKFSENHGAENSPGGGTFALLAISLNAP